MTTRRSPGGSYLGGIAASVPVGGHVPNPLAAPSNPYTPNTPNTPNPPTTTTTNYTPPDYAALIANDPAWIQLQADMKAQGISDSASRTAAQQRAAIQFGEAPSALAPSELGLTGDVSAVYDPTVAAAAHNNPFSTVSRLSQAHTDAIRTITNALAARGMLRSGETGFQLGNETRNYGTGQYDARQKLLDYLSGIQSAFISAAQARQSALTNFLTNWRPPPTAGPPTTTTTTPTPTTPGGGVPQDPDQNLPALQDYRSQQGIWQGF